MGGILVERNCAFLWYLRYFAIFSVFFLDYVRVTEMNLLWFMRLFLLVLKTFFFVFIQQQPKQTCGQDHPNVGVINYNMANTYKSKGWFEMALQRYKKVLRIWLKFFDEE